MQYKCTFYNMNIWSWVGWDHGRGRASELRTHNSEFYLT